MGSQLRPSPTRQRAFGPFVFNEASSELTKHGIRVRLVGQPIQILMALIEEPGRVVTREQFQQQLWSGSTFVDFDHGLNAAMNRLRQALGDSADQPRYIETMPGRGYRFIASIQDAKPNLATGIGPELVETASAPPAAPGLNRAEAKRRPIGIAVAVALALVGVFVAWRLNWQQNQQAPRVVPLTTAAGDQLCPSFSPDGNQLAFAWAGEKQDNWDIYVKMIGDATALRLTMDTAEDTCPAWSPNGRRIAFLKFANAPGNQDKARVYSISPLGGPERELADFDAADSRLAWSHDGRFLVVAKAYDEFQHDPGSGALYLIPAEHGEAKPLLVPPAAHWFKNPALSPSGDSLAFISCWGTTSAETCDIYMVAVASKWWRSLPICCLAVNHGRSRIVPHPSNA